MVCEILSSKLGLTVTSIGLHSFVSVRQSQKLLNLFPFVADRGQELDAAWPTRVEAALSSCVQGRHAPGDPQFALHFLSPRPCTRSLSLWFAPPSCQSTAAHLTAPCIAPPRLLPNCSHQSRRRASRYLLHPWLARSSRR
jgi:hypothetical protein